MTLDFAPMMSRPQLRRASGVLPGVMCSQSASVLMPRIEGRPNLSSGSMHTGESGSLVGRQADAMPSLSQRTRAKHDPDGPGRISCHLTSATRQSSRHQAGVAWLRPDHWRVIPAARKAPSSRKFSVLGMVSALLSGFLPFLGWVLLGYVGWICRSSKALACSSVGVVSCW